MSPLHLGSFPRRTLLSSFPTWTHVTRNDSHLLPPHLSLLLLQCHHCIWVLFHGEHSYLPSRLDAGVDSGSHQRPTARTNHHQGQHHLVYILFLDHISQRCCYGRLVLAVLDRVLLED